MSEPSPSPHHGTVPELVEQKARELGDTSLLCFEDNTYSYRDINREANQMAHALLAQDISKGDVVSVFLENSPQYVTLWFALAKIGALMVPLNVDHRGDTLAHILGDSDPGAIVFDEDTRENYETVKDQFHEDLQELTIGETSTRQYRRFDEISQDYPDDSPDIDLKPGDPMGIIYTSGSSGRPKGVVLPHYSYVNTGWEFSQNILNVDTEDRLFTTLPLFHCNAQQTTVMGAMVSETDFLLESAFSPEGFWERIKEYDVTVFNYLGSMIPLLYKQDEEPDDADNPAEYGIGAAAPVEILEAFEERFDVTLIEGYGLTETATVATVNRPDDRQLGSIGKSLSYTRVDIVDEDDNPVPPGEVGEIVVRPTQPNTMMKRYYGRPHKTVDVWQNLWFHTGDLGYRDDDGYFYFVDRKQYAISKQNETISSFEIERIITDHPEIQEVSVFGVSSERDDEDIKAVVVPKQDANLTPVDIIQHCEEHLPYFKLPRYVELVEELPKTPTERVKKYKLKQQSNRNVWDRENGYELIG